MAGLIAKEAIEDVRQACDIVDVLSTYLTVQRRGSRAVALCPFHKEKTPSFNINSEWQTYHCFGCGASGDVFRFLMEYEGLDFTTAVKTLAQRAGIALRIEEGASRDGINRDRLREILHRVAASYHDLLRSHKLASGARDYLAQRDMGDDIVTAFQLGFAPTVRQGLLRWGKREGYSAQDLDQAGLISQSEHGQGEHAYYDRFRDRLMFPIWDEQGRVIGFSGRLLREGARAAKYVNSPETPLFKKNRVLYALHKARKPIVEERHAVLCEGQIDVIRCHAEGITHAVAAQGTAFTDSHARILKRYADVVTILFDADKAGQAATIKAGHTLLEEGLEVRVACLPAGDDPDTFLRTQGADAFRAVLDEATGLLDFHVRVLRTQEDMDSEAGMMRATRQVMETIGRTPNAVQRAILLERAAELLGLPVPALQSEFHHHARRAQIGRAPDPRPTPETPRRPTSAPPEPELPPEELGLAQHVLYAGSTPGVPELLEHYLPFERITHPHCRAFVRAVLTAHRDGRSLQSALLDEEPEPGPVTALAARVQARPIAELGREFSRLEAVRDLVLAVWRRERKMARSALAPTDPEQRQITYDLQQLKRWETGSAVIEALLHA